MWCVPPPTRRGLAAAQHWPHAPAARPPPKGAPSVRREGSGGFEKSAYIRRYIVKTQRHEKGLTLLFK
jgi:hypothetical protein